MRDYVINVPDVGEGVAEVEIVEWRVTPGEMVEEDQLLAAVMTDKATVEIPSPVTGKVLWLACETGQTMAVGAPMVRLEIDGEDGDSSLPPQEHAPPEPKPAAQAKPGARVLAAPAVRKRARDHGVDLSQLAGSGSGGRITAGDLEAYLQKSASPPATSPDGAGEEVTQIKVIGLRRKIADKMSLAKAQIPHMTIIEDVDMTSLQDLRKTLNESRSEGQPKLTIMPFLMRALVAAVNKYPKMNAQYDDRQQVVHQYRSVHTGVAVHTPAGLMVPVVKHTERLDVWACAAALNELAEAARAGTATRDDLTGSTITISSLGALGAVAATPIINHPELAVIGVNRMQIRPVWDGQSFQPRPVMNLSASFDHRIIDGWDGAQFVSHIKALLETPALIFMPTN